MFLLKKCFIWFCSVKVRFWKKPYEVDNHVYHYSFFISCSSKQVELDITEVKKSILAPQNLKELLKRKEE